MNSETILALGERALYVTMLLAAPMLLSALVVGLLVGMLQAATQINEMTLSFIPKLIVLSLAIFIAGPWMLHTLVDYTRNLIETIPSLIG